MANKNAEEQTITISLKKYESLSEDADFLECLRGAGVDNWEGYDITIELFEKMQDEKDED